MAEASRPRRVGLTTPRLSSWLGTSLPTRRPTKSSQMPTTVVSIEGTLGVLRCPSVRFRPQHTSHSPARTNCVICWPGARLRIVGLNSWKNARIMFRKAAVSTERAHHERKRTAVATPYQQRIAAIVLNILATGFGLGAIPFISEALFGVGGMWSIVCFGLAFIPPAIAFGLWRRQRWSRMLVLLFG